jgi:hypothetical protein
VIQSYSAREGLEVHQAKLEFGDDHTVLSGIVRAEATRDRDH